jgi:hypothetical protein
MSATGERPVRVDISRAGASNGRGGVCAIDTALRRKLSEPADASRISNCSWPMRRGASFGGRECEGVVRRAMLQGPAPWCALRCDGKCIAVPPRDIEIRSQTLD